MECQGNTIVKNFHQEKPEGESINVSNETRQELGKLGVWRETMDDIIAQCIRSYKKENKIGFDG